MNLAELITALEAADPQLVVPHGFTNPHSYRGYYDELAFEPASNITVAAMLTDARSALGATYHGYKGGDYTMSEYTDCWLACWGALGETIGPVLLSYMLASAEIERQVCERIGDRVFRMFADADVEGIDLNAMTADELTRMVMAAVAPAPTPTDTGAPSDEH